ncbi:hypothetical protein [Methanobrevibacter sp.]
MLNSLEEDYRAGNISEEKYNNLYNRYQKVLNKIDQEEVHVKKGFKDETKPAPSREQYIHDDDSYDDDVEYEGKDFISENYNILMPALIGLLVISFITAIYIILFL